MCNIQLLVLAFLLAFDYTVYKEYIKCLVSQINSIIRHQLY